MPIDALMPHSMTPTPVAATAATHAKNPLRPTGANRTSAVAITNHGCNASAAWAAPTMKTNAALNTLPMAVPVSKSLKHIASVWMLLASCGSPSACEDRCRQAEVCRPTVSQSCESECEDSLLELEQYSYDCRYAVESAMECLNTRLMSCVAVFEMLDCSSDNARAIDICGDAGRDQAREALNAGQ